MKNKSEEVRKLLQENKYDEALRIGKTFRKGNKELIDSIQRGWDASRNPEFYSQLGMNPIKLFDAAIQSLEKLVNFNCIK